MTGAAGSCNGNKWKYASTNFCSTDPLVNASPNELFGVTGMSVDTAWRTQTGRSDVVIAVHDSGLQVERQRRDQRPAEEVPPEPRRAARAGAGGRLHAAAGRRPASTATATASSTCPTTTATRRSPNVNGNAVDRPAGPDHALLRRRRRRRQRLRRRHLAAGTSSSSTTIPFDEVQYGHGTGEAEDSAAEANNGGAIATCPNCMTLPVRVGDSFVADVNSFAQGVVFSVDTGAAVIQEALGTYNQSAFAQQAIDYAYANDVPVMASAADEDSWHHIFPGPYVHTIMVNAIADFGVPDRRAELVALPERLHQLRRQPLGLGVRHVVLVGGGRARLGHRRVSSSRPGRDAVDATTLASPLTANEIRQLLTQHGRRHQLRRARRARWARRRRSACRTGRVPRHLALRDAGGLRSVHRLRPHQRPRARSSASLAGDIPPEADITHADLVPAARPAARRRLRRRGPRRGASGRRRLHLPRPDRLRRPADRGGLRRRRALRRDAHDAGRRACSRRSRRRRSRRRRRTRSCAA